MLSELVSRWQQLWKRGCDGGVKECVSSAGFLGCKSNRLVILEERSSGEAFLDLWGCKEGPEQGMPRRQCKSGGRKPEFVYLSFEVLQAKSGECSSLVLSATIVKLPCAQSYRDGQISNICRTSPHCPSHMGLWWPSQLQLLVHLPSWYGTWLGWWPVVVIEGCSRWGSFGPRPKAAVQFARRWEAICTLAKLSEEFGHTQTGTAPRVMPFPADFVIC